MTPNLKLSIPRSCDQKWNTFTQTDSGGYCGSCQKVVTDFTEMTDAQIVNFFKTHQSNICGRFKSYQLKEYVTPKLSTVKPGLVLLRAGLISILVMMISKPSAAQERRPEADTVVVENHEPVETAKVKTKFKGIVKDETGSELPGVSVWLKGTMEGTSTDSNGQFEFPAALKAGDVLVFSFVGFTSKEVCIKRGDEQGFQVPLQLCMAFDVMGEVSVNHLYQEPSGFQKLIAHIRNFF